MALQSLYVTLFASKPYLIQNPSFNPPDSIPIARYGYSLEVMARLVEILDGDTHDYRDIFNEAYGLTTHTWDVTTNPDLQSRFIQVHNHPYWGTYDGSRLYEIAGGASYGTVLDCLKMAHPLVNRGKLLHGPSATLDGLTDQGVASLIKPFYPLSSSYWSNFGTSYENGNNNIWTCVGELGGHNNKPGILSHSFNDIESDETTWFGPLSNYIIYKPDSNLTVVFQQYEALTFTQIVDIMWKVKAACQ